MGWPFLLLSLFLLVSLIPPPLDFCFLSCSGPTQINQVVSHPSQPLTITAHDDRGIRFLDNRTGEARPPQPPLTCAVGGRGQPSSEREIGQSTLEPQCPR